MQSLHVAISYFSRFLICLAEYIETSRSLSHSSQQIVVSDVAVGTMDGRGCVEVVSVVSVSVVSVVTVCSSVDAVAVGGVVPVVAGNMDGRGWIESA